MAYHVYTTKGLVLSGSAQGETDKFFSIFTEELGLVFVLGKGIRKKESKLRSHMDDLTFGEFSFVHGKRGFRLVGAQSVRNIWKTFRSEPYKRKAFIGVLRTLVMLLAGQEPDPRLFAILESSLDFLRSTPLSASEASAWQSIVLLRILATLGYGSFSSYGSFIDTDLWTTHVIHDAELAQSSIDRDIHQAMVSSDLLQDRYTS